MRPAGAAICRDKMGWLKLHETAHRTPERCFRRGRRHGNALGVVLARVVLTGDSRGSRRGQTGGRLAWRHLGMTDKCSSLFDNDSHRFEITKKFGVGFELTAFLHSDIAVY